jgi:hypothetical protein
MFTPRHSCRSAEHLLNLALRLNRSVLAALLAEVMRRDGRVFSPSRRFVRARCAVATSRRSRVSPHSENQAGNALKQKSELVSSLSSGRRTVAANRCTIRIFSPSFTLPAPVANSVGRPCEVSAPIGRPAYLKIRLPQGPRPPSTEYDVLCRVLMMRREVLGVFTLS